MPAHGVDTRAREREKDMRERERERGGGGFSLCVTVGLRKMSIQGTEETSKKRMADVVGGGEETKMEESIMKEALSPLQPALSP